MPTTATSSRARPRERGRRREWMSPRLSFAVPPCRRAPRVAAARGGSRCSTARGALARGLSLAGAASSSWTTLQCATASSTCPSRHRDGRFRRDPTRWPARSIAGQLEDIVAGAHLVEPARQVRSSLRRSAELRSWHTRRRVWRSAPLASGRQASLPCRFTVPPPRSSMGMRFSEGRLSPTLCLGARAWARLHHPLHTAHAAHAAHAGSGLFGWLGDDRLGHEDVLRDRRGVLQRRARDHGRVDDPRLH